MGMPMRSEGIRANFKYDGYEFQIKQRSGRAPPRFPPRFLDTIQGLIYASSSLQNGKIDPNSRTIRVVHMNKKICILCFVLATALSCGGEKGVSFMEDFDRYPDRVWIGRDFWSVPLEDWRVEEGRLENVGRRPDMRVNLLTRTLSANKGDFRVSVEAGLIAKGEREGTCGFLLGARDEEDADVRAACYFGRGIPAGVDTEGRLFLGERAVDLPADFPWDHFRLEAEGEVREDGASLTLRCLDKSGKEMAAVDNPDISNIHGLVALANNIGVERPYSDGPRFWFDNLELGGSKVLHNPEDSFGPILWIMYTLSRGTLKMTAQLPPLGAGSELDVLLQIEENGKWTDAAEVSVDPDARTATFKISDWDDSRDCNYRVVFDEPLRDGPKLRHEYPGRIRRDPVDRSLTMGAMTCQFHYGFPYTPLIRNLEASDPDILYFSGDQIYEGNGGYSIIRFPAEQAILNYLGKWYMFGWAFGDLMRDRPTICTPDDHDIYQGNIWGEGGIEITMERWRRANDSRAGYVQPVAMVNAVQRTQCAHLPDPFDPTPLLRGIAAWYTDIVYGRVGFAVISDRIFKSGPERAAFWPEGRRDHARQPIDDPSTLDKPGLILIGERQSEFLKNWMLDWKGVDMKVLLSQTVFGGIPTHHGGAKDFLYADLDSGGWPRSARNRLVDLLRRCFAFHISGDQHVPLLVQYGIDDFRDAGWAHCTPAITVMYERRFLPDGLGWPVNMRPDHGLPNTGAYMDAFGNKNYVYAVGNPADDTRSEKRYERAQLTSSGFSLVRWDKDNRTIDIEAFRFLADSIDPQSKDNQFPGWPLTVSQRECGGHPTGLFLPTLKVEGLENPVVEIVREDSGEIESVVRITGREFRPFVYSPGLFTIRIGDPASGRWEAVTGIASGADTGESITIKFE